MKTRNNQPMQKQSAFGKATTENVECYSMSRMRHNVSVTQRRRDDVASGDKMNG
jgi:hypothetical protein